MLILILTIIKLFLLALGIIILVSIAYVIFSFRNVVPFVPTPRRIAKRMVELAEIRHGERVCDLGSGTGRIIIAAAKNHKNNLIIGIERSALLRFVNKLILLLHPVFKRNVQILNQNFFNLNLSSFDVIFAFVTPAGLRRIAPHFEQLRKGTRLITYMFHLDDNSGFEEKIDHFTSKDTIYVYTKK